MKQKGEPCPRLEARVIDSILRTVIVARLRRRDENIHSQNFVLSKNMTNMGRQGILVSYQWKI